MKNIYPPSILTLFLLFAAALSAQDASLASDYRNAVTLTVGLNQGYFKDQNFSPLNYTSGGTQIGIGYTRTTLKGHRLTTEIGVGLNSLRPGFEELISSDRYHVDISFGYLRALPVKDADRRTYAGVKYRSRLDLTLFDGSEAVTFFAFHGLEVAVETERRTGDRHRLRGGISVPVFGLLSRPPYSGWDKFIVDNARNIPKVVTRGDWVTIGSFVGVRGHLGWAYQFSEHWTAEARYGVAYYATKRIDPVRMLDNTFSLSSTLNF